MEYFEDKVMPIVLEHEGGYVNHPNDPGGATKFGISLRFLLNEGKIDIDGDGLHDFDYDHDGDIDVDDIQNMEKEDAINVYRKWYLDGNFDKLDEEYAWKVFDLSINMGNRQAGKLFQRALRACKNPVQVDGIIGPKTRKAARECFPGEILAALRSEAAGFYRYLTARKPQLEDFLNGWERRAYR